MTKRHYGRAPDVNAVPIKRPCLRCRLPFRSRDRKKEWICDECSRSKEYAGMMDDATPQVTGLRW